MIIYTGQESYSYSTDFFDLFGAHKDLAHAYWQAPTPLIDVCRESDDEIQRQRWFGLVALAFKYRQAREFDQFLRLFLPWLNELEAQGGGNLSKDVIFYVLTQFDAGEIDTFLAKAKRELSPTLRGDTMTMAQQLEQRGLQQGMQQGLQQGKLNGLELVAKKLYAEGMPLEKIAQLTELSIAQLQQLLAS